MYMFQNAASRASQPVVKRPGSLSWCFCEVSAGRESHKLSTDFTLQGIEPRRGTSRVVFSGYGESHPKAARTPNWLFLSFSGRLIEGSALRRTVHASCLIYRRVH